MPILIRYAPSSLTREQYDKAILLKDLVDPNGLSPPLQRLDTGAQHRDTRCRFGSDLGEDVSGRPQW